MKKNLQQKDTARKADRRTRKGDTQPPRETTQEDSEPSKPQRRKKSQKTEMTLTSRTVVLIPEKKKEG